MWARYGRVSTAEQEGALVRQLFELEQCFLDQGWELDDSLLFVDEQSGWDDRESSREAFSRLMLKARSREIEGIVVVRIDRLARETELLARLWKTLERCQVKLFVIEKGRSYDPVSHSDWRDFINDATSAEEESRKISGRVSRAWKYNRHMERASSICPFGYRRSPEKTYEPNLDPWCDSGMSVWECARRSIDILFECRLNERAAVRKIDADLGKHWSLSGFRVWIQNEVLSGDIPYIRYYGNGQKKQSRHADESQGFRHPKEILRDRHTPLITREEARQIRIAIEIKKPRGKNAAGTAQILPLSGLVRCALCGSPATFSSSKGGYAYAYCRARKNRRTIANTRGRTYICGDDPLNDVEMKVKFGKAGISHKKLELAVIKKLKASAELAAEALVDGVSNQKLQVDPAVLKIEENIRRIQLLIDDLGDASGLLNQQIQVWRSQIPPKVNQTIDLSLKRELVAIFAEPSFDQVFLNQPAEDRRSVYRRFVKSIRVRHAEVIEILLDDLLDSPV